MTETGAIRRVLARELRTVRREVEAYPDDELLWREVPGLPNSGGTLALHLAGNLQHYIGAVLGGTGYVRDRDAEFADRGLTRAEVSGRVQAAIDAVESSLARLAPEQATGQYPEAVLGRTVRTADYLVHLVAHLGYHLGQLDYHRRMVTPGADGVGAIALAELSEE
ncbi:MAG: DUF1572 domain-containing protein [Gemmatimonadetes bacterium]|nr:DUF1572 domain-containing protein [Gemmatimonadota bacterium]